MRSKSEDGGTLQSVTDFLESIKNQASALDPLLMRMLIQTGRGLDERTEADLAEFDRAIGEREDAH